MPIQGQLLRIVRVMATDENLGLGYCGALLDSPGWKGRIRDLWGGGTYQAIGERGGRRVLLTAWVRGPSERIGSKKAGGP